MTDQSEVDGESLEGLVALVIDDNDDNRLFLRRWLSAEGIQVLEAATGTTGLEQARHRPDLIICDIRLPDIDGREVTARLRNDPLLRTTPIIQRSSIAVDTDSQIEGLSSGADAYLVEPIDRNLLIATARSLLRFQRASERLVTTLSGDVTGVFDWNIASDRVRWSTSLLAIHGVDADEIVGTYDGFLDTIHTDDRERVGYVISTGLHVDSTIELEYKFLRVDQSVGWMETRATVFRDVKGVATRLLGLSHDVTQQTIQTNRVVQLQRLAAELNTQPTSREVMWTLDEALDSTGIASRWPVNPSAQIPFDMVARYRTRAGDLVLTGEVSERGVNGDQAQALCELAGGALDRALRFDEELDNVAVLHESLLPPTPPPIDGWTTTARSLPPTSRTRVGGDFFDFVSLDGSFVVVIGDVAGQGLETTRQMATVRTLLRTLVVSENGDPVAVLRRATELFAGVCGGDSPLVTALVMTADADGKVTVASAGHPPPIAGRDGRVELLELPVTRPLGVEQEFVDDVATSLTSDDWIACYTDGVFDDGSGQLHASVNEAISRLRGEIDADAVIAAGGATKQLVPDDRSVVTIRRG